MLETAVRQNDIAIYVWCPDCEDIVEDGEIEGGSDGWKLLGRGPVPLGHGAIIVFLVIALIAGAVGFGAGLTLGGVWWKAKAEARDGWHTLYQDAATHLDNCQIANAQARVACPVAPPINWSK